LRARTSGIGDAENASVDERVGLRGGFTHDSKYTRIGMEKNRIGYTLFQNSDPAPWSVE
jgi:hypothetical protein